jgi:hypothetical protein
MLLISLLACTGVGPGPTPEAAPAGPEVLPEAPSTDDTGDRFEPEFFDDAVVHDIAITLSSDAVRDLGRRPDEYVEGAVTVDGASFARVGVRLRGKIGSFRDLDGKPKFKIDFNRFVEDQQLGAHETLALNNAVVDCSFLREPLGYAVFRALGLPAPRTVYTNVSVNGEPYGLYVGVEFPDDAFLEDRYAEPDGNLYDGKYLYFDNGSYALVDFTTELAGNFTLEEGEDVASADIYAIRDAVYAEGTFDARFGGLVDLPAFHRHVAAEQWMGHLDGYALNTNNYRVYFDPADGLADLLVYDLDYGFYDPSLWGMSWGAPRGVLAGQCFADAACAAAHAAAVADVVATLDTDALVAQVDTWTTLIDDAARDDPRRECPRRSIAGSQAEVRAWAANGSANLAAYWGVGAR